MSVMDVIFWTSAVMAMLAVGLICVGFGRLFCGRRRASEPDRPRRKTNMPLVMGGTLLVLVGCAYLYNPYAFVKPFLTDHIDPRALAQLQEADLTLPHPEGVAVGEWPQWRGPNRDGRCHETGLLQTWPAAGPDVVWRAPIQGGYSSFAVADGRLYTMDYADGRERVVCLEADTGKPVWEHSYSVDYAGVDYASGPRATPAVHDGRVYTVGATGLFHCLEANPPDGQPIILWQHDLLGQFDANLPSWGVACSPLIEADLVIVQPGGSQGTVAAFNRISGELHWAALSDNTGYSSPIAATVAGVRQIICFTGHYAVGLSPADGRQLWGFEWITDHDANIATPVVAGDYVFISSGYGTGCALLSLKPWMGGVRADPVYVRRNKLMRNHHSTCVVHDGHLYGFDRSLLKCIDLRTAEEKWVSREPGKGSLIYADGNLIALSESGKLILAEATPEGFHENGSMRLFNDGQIWASPVVAGGRLFVRGGEEIVCLDVKQPQTEAPADGEN